MKDIISFSFFLTAFVAGSVLLHGLVNLTGLSGLPAFLVFCLPLIVVIASATKEDSEKLIAKIIKVGLWGYSFILAVAGLAWFIGV